ncbi:ABC transporter [Streptomyces sp. NBC_00513]|uniref:ABC transporter n=1 Tax=unclassified Streptomyces TaxID=2593676 RepID=UPI0022517241|nr:ABC transporter [Streptomyces sp. NBC_00424]MCX5072791.1 ABC transporter [Streptomyces sp. NBC_00424]WUD43904.1 ABC transporter [Streptomyces sp. NBC_00513]
MTALLRYQAELLLRSQRWLAPVLLYAALPAIGVRPGDPMTDSLGLASAALVPVAAWLVRVCVAGEPDAARDCAAAARGPVRVHAAVLLTALGGATIIGCAGAAVVLAVCAPAAAGRGPAALAGAGAVLVCALTGTAVGALSGRPLLRGPGLSVAAAGLGSLLALVTAGSPARAAVTGLVTGSVAIPVGALAVAAVAAGAAGAVACRVAARRG